MFSLTMGEPEDKSVFYKRLTPVNWLPASRGGGASPGVLEMTSH